MSAMRDAGVDPAIRPWLTRWCLGRQKQCQRRDALISCSLEVVLGNRLASWA